MAETLAEKAGETRMNGRAQPVNNSHEHHRLADSAGAEAKRDASPIHHKAPALSIIIPTYNERGNIGAIAASIEAAMPAGDWEIIFVDDDSSDGTSELARAIAEKDARIRCIRRVGRRGLSSAVIEGILSSSAQYVAVMDGDRQHDEGLLAGMLELLRSGHADMVIGSRYIDGGDAGGLGMKQRHTMSRIGTLAARRFLGVEIRDPMSGYFMMPRALFDRVAASLSGQGFKILLDILVSLPKPVRVIEVPMMFRARLSGDSKLDVAVLLAFARMLIDKTAGRYVPTEFVLFLMVGASGILVHLAALRLAIAAGIGFDAAQMVASLTAMTSNFWINNRVTFCDRRLRGLRFAIGLLSFYAVCSFGLIGNIGVAHLLFTRRYSWWAAGVAGAIAGAVWNYAASSFVTWGRRK